MSRFRIPSLVIGLIAGSLLSLAFLTGVVAGAFWDRHEATQGVDISNPDVRDFLSAYHLVTQRSYYRPFNTHRLMYAAIDGMLSATGDPHTIFLPPPQNHQADRELNGAGFTGIGAIVAPWHGEIEVTAPIPGSPSARAGIQSGDFIIRINGVAVSHLSGDQAVARIHGRAGTYVRLTIRRGTRPPFTVNVKRAVIAPITAYGRFLPHRLGYVQVISFGDDTADQVRAAIAALVTQKMRGLVLDLRGDPGGYVQAAQDIVGYFVSQGVVAYERNGDGTLTALPVPSDKLLTRVPIAILVDGGTASAAEITAAALRDHGRAILIGSRTYGKGSMQSVFSLSDGSTVRITDRLWLTPKKQSVSKVGLKPNISQASDPALDGTPGDADLNTAEHYLLLHAP